MFPCRTCASMTRHCGFPKSSNLPNPVRQPICSPNPPPHRVTVNRFWQEIFGNGFVRTSGDFGVAGELPSHPELLDWLAVDFRENGWDVQRFFKQVLMSSTYRQSAAVTKDAFEKDR